jgi:exosortase A
MAVAIDDTSETRLTWRFALLGLILVLAAFSVAYAGTLEALVATWRGSDTYAHGFLILPISLWLIWEKRAGLQEASPRPTAWPVLLMLPAGGLWLVAHLVDVMVVQEYAFVSLVILAIWALVGTAVARYLAFPIGFLLLAVPVGEGLTHPMMNLTADFTVKLVRLSGIPVYRDGTFFSLPTGDWSVIDECSGIRYLLASVTLGVLFAYLTYSTLWKRIAFVGFSILVPVVANVLRAYLIVMIAHLSDMRLATGVDHLIYGWVFFGIVIAIMFAIGAIWREPMDQNPPTWDVVPSSGRGGLVGVSAAVVAAAVLWPVLALVLDRGPEGGVVLPVPLTAPAPETGWQVVPDKLWSWRPLVANADGEYQGFYQGTTGPVGLYLAVYRIQREDAEVVNERNQMVAMRDPQWSDKETSVRELGLPSGTFAVNQSRITSRVGDRKLLVWNWYHIGEVNTGNPYLAKLAEAGYRLIGQHRPGALVVVSAPYQNSADEAARVLEDFIVAMLPAIEAEIARAVAPSS